MQLGGVKPTKPAWKGQLSRFEAINGIDAPQSGAPAWLNSAFAVEDGRDPLHPAQHQ